MRSLEGPGLCRRLSYSLGLPLVALVFACSSNDDRLSAGLGGPLEVGVEHVDFDSVKVGESKLRSVTIRNTGDRAVNLCLPYLSGAACGTSSMLEASTEGFEWPLSDMTWTLGAGASSTFNVRFAPTVSGTVTATLRLAHDGLGGPAEVQLSGVGEGLPIPIEPAVEGCRLVAAERALDFGESLPSVDRVLSASVENEGDADCTMDAVTLSGDSAFMMPEALSASWTLAPGATKEVLVAYHSSTAGAHQATLSFGASESVGVDITLEGRTREGPLALELAPRVLDVGRAVVGCDAPTGYLRVHNDSAASQGVENMALAPGSSSAFELWFGGLPTSFVFRARVFLELDVRFRPLVSGDHFGVVFIDLADGTRLAVPIHGVGVTAESDHATTEVFGAPGASPADIIFVVEMTEETSRQRTNLVDAFPDLLAALDGTTPPMDYRIAVAAMGRDSAGRFLRTAAGAFAITPTTADPTAMFRTLMLPDDVPPAGTLPPESGSLYDALLVAFRSIGDRVVDEENAGFLRDEASLSIVLLTTDEEPYVEGELLEPLFDFVGHFKGKTRGEGRAHVHAIVSMDVPLDANSEPGCDTDDGWGWYAPLSIEVAALTGGRAVSICQPYSNTVSELAPYLAGRSSRFWLAGRPMPSSIQVKVNQQLLAPSAWFYDDFDDSVTLFSVLTMTDEVGISYALFECAP
ncbi:MAG: choice-of-anchor D domain-containing protein [Deltaproteobacteria bacterium]|nr:choice-of-anchor D domain-containing protein [Deltaproteobacteria bacterium]